MLQSPSPREVMSLARCSKEESVKRPQTQCTPFPPGKTEQAPAPNRLKKMHPEETCASMCQLAADTACVFALNGSFWAAFIDVLEP